MQHQTKTQLERVTINQTTEEPIRYCLYARKSTEEDERQAMSIDSQIKEMGELALRENLKVIEIKQESHSAKQSGTRPVLMEMLQEIRDGKFDGILTWAPDRLSRNGGDLGMIVDLMDQGHLKEIRAHSQKFTNNPNEKFLLMILGSQAKLENDHRSINVKRGMRAKCEKGYRPSPPPLGYVVVKSTKVGEPNTVTLDPERASAIKEMFERVATTGATGRQIQAWLNRMAFRSRGGKPLSLSVIYKTLRDPCYTGRFEYPVGSGKWYEGKYESLVSQKIFDQVQEHLNQGIKSKEVKPWTKEFDFVRMMTCGSCGSGIGAIEKVKTIKTTGITKRYVYYYCNKLRDKDCKEPYVREEKLLEQLTNLMDKVDLDGLKTKRRFVQELERFRQFASGVLGQEQSNLLKPKDLDVRNYAKYILKQGSRTERRELLSTVSSKLKIAEQKIYLQESTQQIK